MADSPAKSKRVKLPLPPPAEDESRSRLRISAELPSQPDPLDASISITAPPQRIHDPALSLDGYLVEGRYRVIAPLGEGGMGRVFKVVHVQLGKTLALKVIHQRIADDVEARDRFYKEARTAASLSSHANITSIEDFGTDPKVGAYMVMEYLAGEKLSSVLRRDGKLSLRHACDTMLQTADAIRHVHEKGVVHCDVKTENIFLIQTKRQKRRHMLVKLLDFGLSERMADMTAGTLSGTPEYMAPERIRGGAATPQTDIYALGVLFYEILTGGPPFVGTTDEVLTGHLEEEPLPPSSRLASSLDTAVEHLILKALEKDPANRHKDAAAFIYELRTVMHMLGFSDRQRAATTRVVEKVVKEPLSRRDSLARLAFDSNRLPMALLSEDGTILLANPAFSKFVMGRKSRIEGLTVQSTPLAKAWTTLDADLARAVRGRSIRRVMEVDGSDGSSESLVMRVEPVIDSQRVIFTVYPLVV